MGLDGERNRKGERERERKLGRKTHLGVESCVQFCRSSEITASTFISTALARKIASADCTSHETELFEQIRGKKDDFVRFCTISLGIETFVISREMSMIVASPPSFPPACGWNVTANKFMLQPVMHVRKSCPRSEEKQK